jgi:hypothetical protein
MAARPRPSDFFLETLDAEMRWRPASAFTFPPITHIQTYMPIITQQEGVGAQSCLHMSGPGVVLGLGLRLRIRVQVRIGSRGHHGMQNITASSHLTHQSAAGSARVSRLLISIGFSHALDASPAGFNSCQWMCAAF